MPIAICGVREVPEFANTPFHHIISIRDYSQSLPDIRGFKNEFTLHAFLFDDTGDVRNQRAPQEQNIQRLLNVYATTRADQNILFHCFAGVSRSTAAAFIWLVYHGVSYADAYQMIVAARGPFVCPNQLMVKHADQLMDKNGEMSAFLSAEIGRRTPERDAFFNKCGSNTQETDPTCG